MFNECFFIENIERRRITSGDDCKLSFFLSHHHNKAFLLLLTNGIHLSRKHRMKELCFYLATKRCYATSAYQNDREKWKEMFHFLRSNILADCLYQNSKQSEKLWQDLASNIIFSRSWENEQDIRIRFLSEVKFFYCWLHCVLLFSCSFDKKFCKQKNRSIFQRSGCSWMHYAEGTIYSTNFLSPSREKHRWCVWYRLRKRTQESQSDLQIRSFSIGSASDFIGIRHFS